MMCISLQQTLVGFGLLTALAGCSGKAETSSSVSSGGTGDAGASATAGGTGVAGSEVGGNASAGSGGAAGAGSAGLGGDASAGSAGKSGGAAGAGGGQCTNGEKSGSCNECTCTDGQWACTNVVCAKVCGSLLGGSCSATEYCAYTEGQLCGAADASSTCEPRPTACDLVYSPVCGCDQMTYSSTCDAAMHGQGVYANGACGGHTAG